MSDNDEFAEVEEKIEEARERLEAEEHRNHPERTFADPDGDGEPDPGEQNAPG